MALCNFRSSVNAEWDYNISSQIDFFKDNGLGKIMIKNLSADLTGSPKVITSANN